MRRPTCVTDSAGRSRMTGDQLVFEACHLAHAANHINRARRLPRRAKLERDASRVVAPVLKALEARDQHVDGASAPVYPTIPHMENPFGRLTAAQEFTDELLQVGNNGICFLGPFEMTRAPD